MIRQATVNDIKDILKIVEEAREQFKEYKFRQWGNGYPSEETFLNDINENILVVYTINDEVCGVMAIDKKINPDYINIDGSWLSDNKYYTIHRIAVKKAKRRHNIGLELINYAANLAKEDKVNLRIDTHPRNLPMLGLIERAGFSYCGITKLVGVLIEPIRNVYEMVL